MKMEVDIDGGFIRPPGGGRPTHVQINSVVCNGVDLECGGKFPLSGDTLTITSKKIGLINAHLGQGGIVLDFSDAHVKQIIELRG